MGQPVLRSLVLALGGATAPPPAPPFHPWRICQKRKLLGSQAQQKLNQLEIIGPPWQPNGGERVAWLLNESAFIAAGTSSFFGLLSGLIETRGVLRLLPRLSLPPSTSDPPFLVQQESHQRTNRLRLVGLGVDGRGTRWAGARGPRGSEEQLPSWIGSCPPPPLRCSQCFCRGVCQLWWVPEGEDGTGGRNTASFRAWEGQQGRETSQAQRQALGRVQRSTAVRSPHPALVLSTTGAIPQHQSFLQGRGLWFQHVQINWYFGSAGVAVRWGGLPMNGKQVRTFWAVGRGGFLLPEISGPRLGPAGPCGAAGGRFLCKSWKITYAHLCVCLPKRLRQTPWAPCTLSSRTL